MLVLGSTVEENPLLHLQYPSPSIRKPTLNAGQGTDLHESLKKGDLVVGNTVPL